MVTFTGLTISDETNLLQTPSKEVPFIKGTSWYNIVVDTNTDDITSINSLPPNIKKSHNNEIYPFKRYIEKNYQGKFFISRISSSKYVISFENEDDALMFKLSDGYSKYKKNV